MSERIERSELLEIASSYSLDDRIGMSATDLVDAVINACRFGLTEVICTTAIPYRHRHKLIDALLERMDVEVYKYASHYHYSDSCHGIGTDLYDVYIRWTNRRGD